MEERYTDTSKKVWDFIGGFFFNVFIGIGYFFSYFLVGWLLSLVHLDNIRLAVLIVAIMMFILIILLEFFLIRSFFRKGMRYFAIGMIASAVLPLLVSGFCSAIFTGLSNI